MVALKNSAFDALSEARRAGLMNIGAAAQATGVSAKMIRHYEAQGLLPRANRTASGYRLYRDTEVHTLRFIRRARDLGFSMKDIASLLGLWSDRRRASADVKRMALRHVDELNGRIASLEEMRETLQDLVHHCHGNERPECPILDELSQPGSVPVDRTAKRPRQSTKRG
jgi:Cu(I)-responsive transcriptional regulator